MKRCAIVFKGVPNPLVMEGSLKEVESKILDAQTFRNRTLRWKLGEEETAVNLGAAPVLAVWEFISPEDVETPPSQAVEPEA
jgi:hypothetical protein